MDGDGGENDKKHGGARHLQCEVEELLQRNRAETRHGPGTQPVRAGVIGGFAEAAPDFSDKQEYRDENRHAEQATSAMIWTFEKDRGQREARASSRCRGPSRILLVAPA